MLSLTIAAILLATSDAPVATPAPTNAIDPDQKIKCKAAEETGTLVTRRKICMTIRQWKELASKAQGSGEKMIEQGAICPSCQGH